MKAERFASRLIFGLCLCLFYAIPVVALSPGLVEENNHAAALLAQGRPLEGLALFKQLHGKVPQDNQIKRNLLHAYQAAGYMLQGQKHFEQLAELMLEAQDFDDERREFWILRGYALLMLKRYDEAETEFLEALGMGEPDAGIYYQLGMIYYQTDRMYLAFDSLESALLYDPEHHAAGMMLEKVRRELAVEGGMDKEYGGHFVITFDGQENDELGAEVLEALEEAYNWIGSQLDHYPDQRVTVILYSRQQFRDVTNSPEWSGGLYDGKIRLPVGGISAVSKQVRALLYHEFMHVVLRDIAGNRLPVWLNEGLAEVAEAQIVPPAQSLLSSGQGKDKLFPFNSLEGPFQRFSGMQVMLAYEQSYLMVNYLIEQYGWHQLRDLVFSLSEGRSISQAIDAVFGDFGLSYSRFEQQWRETL